MATIVQDLPANSQQSTSELSSLPDISDQEELEIQVKTSTPPANHSRDSNDNIKLSTPPQSINKMEQAPQQSRRTAKSISSSPPEAKADAEIEVSPVVSNKRKPAKRSRITASQTTAKPPAKRVKLNARSGKKWEPDPVTQSHRSPLVRVDLRALLLQPAAWDCLDQEDKKEILAALPDDLHILNAGTPEARPNIESLQNDDTFRHDCDQYTSNLSDGLHDPGWLQDAWSAHSRRAAGEFDAYYVRKLELEWETTIPDELKPEHLRAVKDVEHGLAADQSTEAHVSSSGGSSSNEVVSKANMNQAEGSEEPVQPAGNAQAQAAGPVTHDGNGANGITAGVEDTPINSGSEPVFCLI